MCNLMNRVLACAAAALLLGAAGCSAHGEQGQAPLDVPSVSGVQDMPDVSGDDSTLTAVASWETKPYEDEYLQYELPVGWERSAAWSSAENQFTVFCTAGETASLPKIISVQINGLNGKTGFTDLQAQLNEQLGLTETDAENTEPKSTLKVYQTEGGTVVNSFTFWRQTKDGVAVEQNGYVPMGLYYSVAVWATDWDGDTSPTADEIARHLCATLVTKDDAEP